MGRAGQAVLTSRLHGTQQQAESWALLPGSRPAPRRGVATQGPGLGSGIAARPARRSVGCLRWGLSLRGFLPAHSQDRWQRSSHSEPGLCLPSAPPRRAEARTLAQSVSGPARSWNLLSTLPCGGARPRAPAAPQCSSAPSAGTRHTAPADKPFLLVCGTGLPCQPHVQVCVHTSARVSACVPGHPP